MTTAEAVFWAILIFEAERRCVHGHWDTTLGDYCIICDSGMST